jgi:hypothetical protein
MSFLHVARADGNDRQAMGTGMAGQLTSERLVARGTYVIGVRAVNAAGLHTTVLQDEVFA